MTTSKSWRVRPVSKKKKNYRSLLTTIKPYHYCLILETGCLNGGAQIRPQDNTQPRELASRLEAEYHKLPEIRPEENESMNRLYKSWLGWSNSDKAVAYLHTQYHEIEKMNTPLAMKW